MGAIPALSQSKWPVHAKSYSLEAILGISGAPPLLPYVSPTIPHSYPHTLRTTRVHSKCNLWPRSLVAMFPELAPSMDAEDSSNESFRDVEGDFPLFAAVVKGERISLFHSIHTVPCSSLQALPTGTTVLRATDHGEYCSWFRIGPIEAKDQNGKNVQFFVKVILFTQCYNL